MKHFAYLSPEERQKLFYQEPIEFSKNIEKEQLAYALGATLYTPGTKEKIAQEIATKKHEGTTSIVFCLEDSISDGDVERAEQNIVIQMQTLAHMIDANKLHSADVPLLFIRIREPKQMRSLVHEIGSAVHCISGFVFPKFTPANGMSYIQELRHINERYSLSLYGMPILESPEIIYKEMRIDALLAIKAILDSYRDYILNVRIGATDFSGLFGIRRNSATTIYDISVIRDCISDIINIFSRSTDEYVISGPVWEYFGNQQRVLKPQLRQTPFRESLGNDGLKMRTEMLHRYEDGLIHEVLLDQANGLVGKTVIHPSHIKLVQALHVVTLEDYVDAMAIFENAHTYNGVMKSSFSNKMNEVKPHYNWARKTLLKSTIYGVLHEQQTFIDLLTETSNQNIHVPHFK
ncbi:HpcH/HpaI aldolase/citrate lyase family protein [Bacillus sp. DX1.1]|uniref:HpcH/HpaI aldolase/citrate lyase family protein n=1 Tax=unclassified Bacillus (in: firmicutes) TaxID=185979 RepID=UPI0025705CF0|nr:MULTISPECIES: HpcH/HpaI aldolase/citrate lyase family protein [unclassified Bacillus (in: firmicutes)]MDM5157077.1 HpcH/HpaI aldolase/citrate lyase family protein [Bacillus sp. DX1.1]WJE81313.1 HpcH/HpaI aldolase/citrate lyase family protein [Bacillus sp. DX3.1]